MGGGTSLAWIYIQAADYTLLHGVDPIFYNLVLSWLLLIAIGLLLLSMTLQDGLPRSFCLIIAASPAFCGNFLWLGLIGMEHLLFVALSLAAICCWFSTTANTRQRSAICAGLALGLLATTRPEAIALGPLLLLGGARGAGRSRNDALRSLAIWFVGVVTYFGWTWHNFHSLTPDTFRGRSWMWFRVDGGAHSARAFAGFFRQWFQRLPRQFSSHFVETQMRLTAGNRIFTLLVILLLSLIAFGSYSLFLKKPRRVLFLFYWACIHAGIYLVLIPTSGHGGRYQPLLLLLVFPLIFLGVLKVSEWICLTKLRSEIAIYAVIAFAGSASLIAWRSVTIMSTELINETHGRMASWILRDLPHNARIAAFDSGRISYDLARPITDMGGLADSALLPYLTTGNVAAYLQLNKIEYYVVPELEGQDLQLFYAFPPHSLGIKEFCVPSQLYENGYSYTEHAWRCQHLYKLLD